MMTIALTPFDSQPCPDSGYLRPVPSDRSEDVRLVAGVIGGDKAALNWIYQKHGGAMQVVAMRVLRDESLGEDVVQDVFISFWKSPERFDAGRGSLRTFLLTIAHRRAIDILRSEKARTRREQSTGPAHTVDVDHEVWIRSLSEQVRQAVATLGEDERDAISLAYFGGLTYVEVAERLAEPEGTVKSRIRSGLKKLANEMAEMRRE